MIYHNVTLKKVRDNLCLQKLTLGDTAPNNLLYSIRWIFISGDTKNAQVGAAPILKWRDISLAQLVMRVRPLTTAPGPLKVCDIPLSDVSMREFIQVENISKICYEL
jgi:hypothetical protein